MKWNYHHITLDNFSINSCNDVRQLVLSMKERKSYFKSLSIWHIQIPHLTANYFCPGLYQRKVFWIKAITLRLKVRPVKILCGVITVTLTATQDGWDVDI